MSRLKHFKILYRTQLKLAAAGVDVTRFRIQIVMRGGKLKGQSYALYHGDRGERYRSIKEITQEQPRRSTRPHHRPLEYWRNETLDEEEEDNFVIKIRDSGRVHRSLCLHPFNSSRCLYEKYAANHVSDCGCPLHRNDTYWRRLGNHVLSIRGNALKQGNDEYIRKITGMSCQEYKSYLHRKWLNTFSDILSKNTLNMGVEELFACRFYALDEWCPRCSGRPSLEHGLLAQARFFAAAFSAENTQMLINKKKHAEHLGVSIRRYPHLVNGIKVGKVYPDAKDNFMKIEPSNEAVEFWHSKLSLFAGINPLS
ncbi:MAG: hypothetical protein CMA72_07825 [Euryarchaeota archaeon]|nr:hypothetical protein [Euryarchaeota archaeon]